MIAIRMGFLTGRFHATPWGYHLNEGVVEYPPSVWRLLRSLVATFYRVFPDRAHQDKDDNPAASQLKRVVIELNSGCTFTFHTVLAQGLRGASPDDLSEVELMPHGAALDWEKLDADFSVIGLLMGLFGNRAWMEELWQRWNTGLEDKASIVSGE